MTLSNLGSSGVSVAIYSQLLRGSAGGIEANLLSLVRGLANQSESGDTQVLIGPGGQSSWLSDFTGSSQHVLAWPSIPYPPAGLGGNFRHQLRHFRDSFRLARRRQRLDTYSIANLDRKLRELNIDLVHFPYQRYFATSLPFIFEPWDLQHIHLPELFSKEEILFRNRLYSEACRRADVVVVATRTTKYDLVCNNNIPASKIAVIYRGVEAVCHSSSDQYDSTSLLQDHVPFVDQPYAFYPAKPWPHKNHERLFAALSDLKHVSGIRIPLLCTGSPVKGKEGYLESLAQRYGISDQVSCFGFLPEAALRKLFANASLLIFPSLFEGLGIPLLEAMSYGVPIACSNVSCMPEVVGRGALFFDPYSVKDMAAKFSTIWTDEALRTELAQRGEQRAKAFSWEQATLSFLLLYRYVAKHSFSSSEQQQLRSLFA